MRERPIRCVVADGHEALRAGLASCLEEADGIEVIGQAAGGDDAVNLIGRRRPDVAIVDVGLPGMDGLEVCARLRARDLEVRVLMYAASRDVGTLSAALEAGVSGYLLKSGPMTDVVRAVRLLAQGETYIESTLVTGLLAGADTPSALSPRETEVLQLLADGLTTEKVAEALFLSPATVRSYTETAMGKLESRNRTHAVAAAIREGLIA